MFLEKILLEGKMPEKIKQKDLLSEFCPRTPVTIIRNPNSKKWRMIYFYNPLNPDDPVESGDWYEEKYGRDFSIGGYSVEYERSGPYWLFFVYYTGNMQIYKQNEDGTSTLIFPGRPAETVRRMYLVKETGLCNTYKLLGAWLIDYEHDYAINNLDFLSAEDQAYREEISDFPRFCC